MESIQHTAQLLQLELEEDLRQYQTKILFTHQRERQKLGFTWYPIHIKSVEIGIGGQIQISLERIKHLGEPHRFHTGDSITLFANENDAPKDSKANGIVVAMWRDSMRIALHTNETPEWINDYSLGIDWLLDTSSYQEMQETLKNLINAKGDRIAYLRNIFLGSQEPTFSQESEIPDYITISDNLNDSQKKAVLKVLTSRDVAVIYGPPGTGKTTTLVEAIRLTLFSEQQVLVVAPSNTAVDLLTEKLLAKGLRVVRIGNPARIDENLQNQTLGAQINNHPDHKLLKKMRKSASDFRTMAHKYKRNFGKDEREQRKLLFAEAHKLLAEANNTEQYIVQKVLKNAQVITATLVGAVNKYIRDKRFTTVFVDEAAQALEPANWIPILKSDRVVLAGDHCQLPPTVKSQEAIKGGLTVTLMEKLMNTYPQASVMLATQYRMNKDIMQFSNQQFYDNKLEAHHTVATRTLSINKNLYELQKVVTFIDTAGCSFEEKTNTEGQSKYNPEEANLISKHLSELIENIQANEPELLNKDFSVGIISPYNAQVTYLQDLILDNIKLSNLKISSVDGFQGQECDIIYITLVRSNDKSEIGFLADTRRMNVALTRARKRLVVIGDSATLGTHKFYENFLNYINSIDAYQTAWELM